jgi:large-conductance mechanosensitive channel
MDYSKITQKKRKIFYTVIFFAGITLLAWQGFIFRNTIIDLEILIGIIALTGFTAFLVDFENYKKTYNSTGKSVDFNAFMYYFFGFGFIAASLFMLINYYLADNKTVRKSFNIVERTSISGGKYNRSKRQPVFSINSNGKIKELVFFNEFYENMETYTIVDLVIKKGFFGYDIIESKTVE